MNKTKNPYSSYRYPAEINCHAIWLYFRFTLSYRDVEELMPGVEHRKYKGLNNRTELSHQSTRRRKRQMRRFKSPGHAQRFLSAYGPINDLFRPRRHRLTATEYRAARTGAFETWQRVMGAQGNC